MNKKIYSLLSLKPFNEDKDKEKLDNSETPVIRSLIIIISFVFIIIDFEKQDRAAHTKKNEFGNGFQKITLTRYGN